MIKTLDSEEQKLIEECDSECSYGSDYFLCIGFCLHKRGVPDDEVNKIIRKLAYDGLFKGIDNK